MSKSEVLGCLYVAFAAVIWGSNGVFVNLVPLDAPAIAFFRVLFASLALLPLVFLTRRREMVEALRSWGCLVVLGVLLAVGWSLLFQAMKLIPIASAVFLNYMAPVFAVLLAPVFLKERLEKRAVSALAVSVAGMVVMTFQHGFHIQNLNFVGVVSGVLAGLGYAGFVVASKKALTRVSSEVAALYSYMTAAVILSPSLVGASLPSDPISWVFLICLGAFNTGFAVTLYLKGLSLTRVQKAMVLTYLEPVSATVFGAVFLAQAPTVQTLVGGALILAASYMATSK